MESSSSGVHRTHLSRSASAKPSPIAFFPSRTECGRLPQRRLKDVNGAERIVGKAFTYCLLHSEPVECSVLFHFFQKAPVNELLGGHLLGTRVGFSNFV